MNYLKDEAGWDSTILYRQECVILMMLEVISPHISGSSRPAHPAASTWNQKSELMIEHLYAIKRYEVSLSDPKGSLLFVAAATMLRTQTSSSVLVKSKSLFRHSPEIMNIMWLKWVEEGGTRNCFRPVQQGGHMCMERVVTASLLMPSAAPRLHVK